VTMDAAKSVTATFGTGQFALAVKVTSRGAVRSTPSGIACPKSCSHLFAASSTVHLAAKAAKGYRFTGWSGACRGTKGCAVKLDSAKRVRAGFRKRA
jgi:Divergent InlB B-repeat domain